MDSDTSAFIFPVNASTHAIYLLNAVMCINNEYIKYSFVYIQKCKYIRFIIAYVVHSSSLLFSNKDHKYTIHINLKWCKNVGTIHVTCILSFKHQNALDKQANLEAMHLQYNEAQANAQVLAQAQAQE